MENEFSDNLENNFNDNSNFKSLEDFFGKDISTFLTPQEIMVMSLSLSHTARVLNMYNKMTNIAVFDIKKFVKENPEYINTDFNNLDENTANAIRKILIRDNQEEEFNKGDILLNSIISVATNIGMKLCDSYIKEYNDMTPEDTIQFFSMLENCLNSALSITQRFFQERS